MSTIKINELASSAISLTDFFAKADASGVANKNTIQGLSNFLNTVGTLAFKGVLLAADAAVTQDGIYVAGDAGTYTNNGGLVITLGNKVVLISITGTQTVFEKVEFPLSITIDATVVDGSANAVQGNAVFDALALKVNTSTQATTENIVGSTKYFDGAKTVTKLKAEVSTDNPSDADPTKFLKAGGIFNYDNLINLNSLNNSFISVLDGASKKKIVFPSTSPCMISFNGKYFKLPTSLEFEFSANYKSIGIDLTNLPANSLECSVIELTSYNRINSKTFLPIASIWESNTVEFNPLFKSYIKINGHFPEINININSEIKNEVSFDSLKDVVSFNVLNTTYIKEYQEGFEDEVFKITSTSSSNFFRLLDYTSPTLDNNSLDFTKKLYLEFDYKIISGNWDIIPYNTPGSISFSSTKTLTNNGKIQSAFFEFDIQALSGITTKLINFFRCSISGGELWFSNMRHWQSDDTSARPKSSNSLKSSNSISLNSVNITTEKAKQVFESELFASNDIGVSKNIVLSGSSITWGVGDLDSSFVASFDEYLKNKLSDTVLQSGVVATPSFTLFSNPKQYKGVGKQINALNSKISFESYGDEINICQAIKRTTDWGKMQVKADGVVIGQFTNHNRTLGSKTDNLVGDGSAVKFELTKANTYNHVVTVNGVSKVIQFVSGYGGTIPNGVDAVVVRKLNSDGTIIHTLWFAVAPPNGQAIVVSYDYGKVIFHEKSTVGQTVNDETNETNYGDGDVSFDPANPSGVSSGLEFRSIDKRAFFNHKFLEKKNRSFEIEIIDGTNPYFIFNFANNRFHNLMNAGIGGWSLINLLNNDNVNDYNYLFKEFMPNVIVNESATNDDWDYGVRRLRRTTSGLTESQIKDLWTLEMQSVVYDNPTYSATFTSGVITSLTQYSLISSEIIGSGTVIGDIVRIGTYYGDNKQVTTRKISTVNLTTGEITFTEPLNPDTILNIESISDLVGAEISIRDLSGYENQYKDLIEKMQVIAPQAKILVTQPGLSNYYTRQLWGYDIIHRNLANLYHNVDTIEVTDWLHDFQKNNIIGTSFENITANGSTLYSLVKTGHWQGFKVWVNGEDVYGKDCYIKGGNGYSVNQAGSGTGLEFNKLYNKDNSVTKAMKLVFTNNIPTSGTVRVEYADSVWSDDFTHPNFRGSYVYGQIYNQKIKSLL